MTRPRKLPALAADFVDSLKVRLKPSTIQQYRSCLFVFHDWLEAHRHSVTALNRQQASRWLRHLVERGQSPVTRANYINPVRAYLRALDDAGLLTTPADELIQRADLPKIPVYLPRPFSPAIDRELQRRLAASSHRYHRGLLVMRNTGLRVGELSGLSFDCIWEDELGQAFLKVPLGKLNTERLVPLDKRTLALVKDLQRTGRPARRLLLESDRGLQPHRGIFAAALREVAVGLSIPSGVTTHRLRHTYATTLLGAGMSLPSLMKLLGHTDYRMTLRYAEITLETVGTEYRAALAHLEKRYPIALTSKAAPPLDPGDVLRDVIRWVQKRETNAAEQKRLVKRLRKIRDELSDLAARSPSLSGRLAG